MRLKELMRLLARIEKTHGSNLIVQIENARGEPSQLVVELGPKGANPTHIRFRGKIPDLRGVE